MSRGGSGRGGRGKSGRNNSERKGNQSQSKGRSSKTTTFMTPERARAIQAHADKTGRNQDFKSRAMSSADGHENDEESIDE